MTVPKIAIGNEVRDMTPEEVAAWEAEQAAYVPPAEQLPPLSRQQIAAVRVPIENGDVGGVERSLGLSFAMMGDEATAWIFFEEEQPDTAYIVTPPDGVTKFVDRLEVAIAGLTSIALIVERVQ